ncbi:hypothetical protein OG21DRAFT_1494986 [Imleria badia]|nr:hypothetical protein OG21DRAFT_1494986 [Imleria badia]
MREQSTSLWTMNPAWTDRVERSGTREVDTVDLAAIKAQPDSTSHQQPESSPISMPPITRSRTARSTKPLPTLEEDLRNIDVSDNEGEAAPQTPPQTPAPAHDAEAEGPTAEDIETRTTPKSRKVASSIQSFQIGLVLAADPNEGRCLITNVPSPATVQLCHLVAQATKKSTLSKLEHVWGIKTGQFNLHTRYNVLRLRSDWHTLFDRGQWMLVPEVRIIEELKKIYLTDECPTSDLRERFENEKGPFNYYVVPAPSLRDAICRFANVDSYEHKTYAPPFSELGPLKSHIHPHYVIFNTGQKISNVKYNVLVVQMSGFLSQMLSITVEDARLALDSMEDLYTKWTETQGPEQLPGPNALSNPSHPPSEEGQDGPSQGGPPPRREGLRSGTRSQGQGSQASAGQHGGGQQRAIHPFQPPEDDDSSSVTDDTIVEDDTAWIEYIHNWQKQGEDVAESWELDVLNNSRDKQLSAYINEHARTPPSPGVWNRWEPAWDDRKSRYPSESDRAQFSSNDWAVFKNDVYLTRPDHPLVTL